MQTYVGRQPIFDRTQAVVAYELLFRDADRDHAPLDAGDRASLSVLRDQFFSTGRSSLTYGRPAFINFTRDLLLSDVAELFDPDAIVVEVLESVEPDREVVRACRRLAEAGYRIALDDYTRFEPAHVPLLELAHVVKVDFRGTDAHQQRRLADGLAQLDVQLLAEKVETPAERDHAAALGYALFQGFFFSRPALVATARIAESQLAITRLLEALHRAEPDITEIGSVIKTDLALTYGLLRYINSAAFSLRDPVHSIRHALVLLGAEKVRKWATLVGLSLLAGEDQQEIIINSLIRARFCEQIAAALGLEGRQDEAFLVGLFSLIDALTRQPLEQLLAEMRLPRDVTAALLQGAGPLAPPLTLAVAQEQARWETLEALRERLGLAAESVAAAYLDAVAWAQVSYEVCGTAEAA